MTSLVAGVGGSAAVGPASGGKVYAYNSISTTPKTVAQANPNRTSLTFYNPGPITIYVAPVNVQAIDTPPASGSSGANVLLNPTLGTLGGCVIVYANGGSISITGECQGAYQAFSASGVNNPLTVMDTNV